MTDREIKALYLNRQHDLIPLDVLHTPVRIIGAGAIGSWTALGLAKMGIENIEIWDDGKVEAENVGPQLYGPEYVGEYKVDALSELLGAQTGISNLAGWAARYEPIHPADPWQGIYVIAVDSMEARKRIWECHKGRLGCALYIDARMAIETLCIWAMQPSVEADFTAYSKTLFDDANSVQETCTNKATVYTAMMAGAQITKVVKDFLVSQGRRYPRVQLCDISRNVSEVYFHGER